MAKQLSEKESWDLIRRGSVGRLGCVADGEPYVVPINYLFEDNSIYSHSLPGRKIQILRGHPRACIQIDEIESDFEWRSVIAFGNYQEVISPDERRAILRKLFARFPKLTPVESLLAEDAGPPPSVVFRILVDRLTGVVGD